MQYFYSSLLALSLLATGATVSAQTSIESKDSHQYPDEFIQDYTQECMQTSMTEGLAEAEAKQLCDCTINKFQSQYSLAEFKQLTTASIADKQAETTLVEVGQVCFEQILYEE